MEKGLAVTTITGKAEKYVVERVEEWVKLLADKDGLKQEAWQNAR